MFSHLELVSGASNLRWGAAGFSFDADGGGDVTLQYSTHTCASFYAYRGRVERQLCQVSSPHQRGLSSRAQGLLRRGAPGWVRETLRAAAWCSGSRRAALWGPAGASNPRLFPPPPPPAPPAPTRRHPGDSAAEVDGCGSDVHCVLWATASGSR